MPPELKPGVELRQPNDFTRLSSACWLAEATSNCNPIACLAASGSTSKTLLHFVENAQGVIEIGGPGVGRG